MNIYEMTAGRLMDALIAEHVMGWKVSTADKKAGDVFGGEDPSDLWIKPVPYYSSSIALAWQIVERMQERDDDAFYNELSTRTPLIALSNSDAALAICRAAWVAVRDNASR